MRFVSKWEPMLDLPGITVEHRFVEVNHDDDASTIADTEGYWHYRQFRVCWYLPRCTSLDDDELEEAVVHEYVHVMDNSLESMMPENADAERMEYATQNIAHALVKVHRSK